MIETAGIALLFLAYAAFAGRRSLRYLHLYQQEEYDSPRFLKWLWKNKVFDRKLSIAIALCSGAGVFLPDTFIYFMIFSAFAIVTYTEKDPRKDSKKKLVMTARARRIFFPACAMAVAAGLWCVAWPGLSWLWIINAQILPLWLVLANAALQPYENAVQKKFRQEAQEKIRDYAPKVIGITGSFGKTSVKHILGHILKAQAPTLVTPGSVNTPMGITRIIREQLEPQHRFFVVEMGAYGPGSIARLCALTPPDMGVITAIGHAHYERFGTLDTVAETKYELARAVIDRGGKMIVHERTLRFDHASKTWEANPSRFVVCGDQDPADRAGGESEFPGPDDLEIRSVVQKPKGLEVQILWRGQAHTLGAPLYGLHHGHNIALAFAAARELGVEAADIQTALQSLPQIQHRLEVKPQGDGTVIIDDAYNSNPVGFQAALDLLACMETGGRRILITPGMVELGRAHEEAHEKVGRVAGRACDVALVIRGERIPSFIRGFRETAGEKPLHEFGSFAEAQKWIFANKKPGDVILIENDLPDIYEQVPRF